MILEYHCENYCSIGKEIAFSLLASNDNSLQDNLEPEDISSRKILRSAVIYGANGSGKSNFIRSLRYLKTLVVNSIRFQPGDRLPFFPHKLLEDRNTKFTIHFTKGKNRFLYYVELNDKRIEKEYLYYYPNNRVAKIFEREKDDVSFSKPFASQLAIVKNSVLKENRLFLSCAASNSNTEEIIDAFTFFNNDIVVLSDQESYLVYSTRCVQSDSKMKESVLDFMHQIGEKDLVGISAKADDKTETFDSSLLFNRDLTDKPSFGSTVKLNYGLFTLDLNESSSGLQKLFEILPPFIDIINNDKILLVDEFETHLHPLMVSQLLKLFKQASQSKAQMIFTTHDINLLSLDLFRRDQIWFTDMCDKHMSDLFSLAEVKAVRKDENISKNYLLGKYRGIPMVDSERKIRLLDN